MRTPAQPHLNLAFLAWISIALVPLHTGADTVTWNGTESSDVLNGLNWSSGNIPGVFQIAISDNAGLANQPTLGGSLTVDLWRQLAGNLSISPGAELNATLLVTDGTGSATVGGVVNGGVDHFGGLLTVTGTINGSLISSADVALTGGTITSSIYHIQGSLTLSGNGTSLSDISLNGGTLNANGGSHVIPFFSWTGGTVNVNAGKLTTLSALNLPQAALNLNGGTFALGGGGTHAGDLLVPAGAALEFSGGTHTLDAGVSIGGDFRLTGGQLVLPGDLDLAGSFVWGGGNISLANGAEISNPDGAAIEIADAVTASITGASGTFQNDGTFTKGFASNITIEPAFTNTGHVTVLGGGSLNFAGGFTQTAGTLEIGSSATAESSAPLIIEGGLVTHAVDSTIAADVTVSGGTIMQENLLPLGSLDIAGDLNVNAGTTWVFRIGPRFHPLSGAFVGYENNLVSEAGVESLNLNGSLLNIGFNNIFGINPQPDPTDTFTILESNQPIVGVFGNQNAGTGRVFFDGTTFEGVGGKLVEGGSFLVTRSGNNLVLSDFAPAEITAASANYLWTGANGDNDWDSPANWDTFSVPRSNSGYLSSTASMEGVTVRKTDGLIRLTSVSIEDGRLILADEAKVSRATGEIVLGVNGVLQLGEGGAPPALQVSVPGVVSNTRIRGSESADSPGLLVIDHSGVLSTGDAEFVNISLLHQGDGITHLSGNRSFSGGVTVTAGRLGLPANNALGAAPIPLLLDGGGLRYNAAFNNLRSFTLGSNGGILDTNGFSPSYSQTIPQTGPFSKDGAGTLTLTQPHTVTADWSVLAGKLVFQSNMTFSPGSSLSGTGDLDIAGGTTTFEDGASFDLTGTVRLTGGSLVLPPTLALAGMEITGGTVGPGSFTVGGPMIWSGGTFVGNDPAVDAVNAHSGLIINTTASKGLTTRTFNHGDGANPSSALWSGGIINFNSNGIFNNRLNSAFDTDFDGTMQVIFSAPGTFNNAGTFSKTGGTGTTNIGIGFNNSGTVNVDTGILRLDSGGSHSGDFQIAENATIRFGSGTHTFQSGAAFTGDGLVEAQFGAFHAAADMSIETGFLLTSSQVTGPGRITVTGPVSLTGGSFQGTDASTQFFEAFGGLSIANSFVLTSRTFNHGDGTNPSTATWNSGAMSFGSGATFNNRAGATFETNFDGTMQILFSGPGNFNNAGAFSKTGGNGTTTVGVAFNNTGMVNVDSGTLSLNGGGTHSGSFAVAAERTLRIGGGTHLLGTGTHLGGEGRFLLADGVISGEGNITLGIPVTWTGGQFAGAGAGVDSVTLTRNVAITGSAFLFARTLSLGDGAQNPIETSWTSGGIALGNGAVLHNRAGSTLDVGFDGGFIFNQFSQSAGVIRNDGVFRKSAPGTVTIGPSMTFRNDGVVEVKAGTLLVQSGGTHSGGFSVDEGAVLTFADGNHTLAVGAVLEGSGEIRLTGGTLHLSEGVAVSARVVISGGTLTGPGATAVNNALVWTGGSLTGANAATDSFTLAGSTTIGGGGSRSLSGRTLFIGDGSEPANASWTNGAIQLGDGAILHIRQGSVLDVGFDGGSVLNQFSNSGGVFRNEGTFRKSGGTGTTTIQSGILFQNSGTVDIQSGTLALMSGGTFATGSFQLAAGAELSLSGIFDFEPGAGFSGDPGSLVTLTSGSASFEGTRLFGSDFDIKTATLTLEGETAIEGGVRFNNTSSVLTGGGDISIGGLVDFVNEGKIRTTSPGSTLTVQGGLRLNSFAATFDGRVVELAGDTEHINGTVNLLNGAVFNHHSASTWLAKGNDTISGGAFNNAGIFVKTIGTGTSTISSTFTNTGLVAIDSGILALPGGGYFTAGTIRIASQAALSLSGSHLFGAGAVFQGEVGSLIAVTGGSTTFDSDRVFTSEFDIKNATLTLEGETTIEGGVRFNNTTSILTGSGDVTIGGLVDFVNEGKIRTTSLGSTLTVMGGLRLNSFAATFDGRVVELAGDTEHINGTVSLLNGAVFNHHADSTWLAKGNNTISGGSFNNAGAFTKDGGTGTSTVASTFTNTGTVLAKSGTISFSEAYTQTAGALLLEGGIVAKSGGSLDIQGGVVAGSGNINGNLILGPTAQLLPGSSPGILTIGGNFTLSGGRVVLEIGGTVPGVDHDQLNITGAFQYNSGTIELVFIGGFAPQEGQTFEMMDTGSTSGTPQIVVKGLEPGWQFSAVRDPVTGVLTVESLSDGVTARGFEITDLAFSNPPPETTGKNVSVIASGVPGAQVRLEASDVLSGWETIATVTLGEDGTAPIEAHDEEAGAQRFYRLASP
jgi:autotransporter-associated beta strand protein